MAETIQLGEIAIALARKDVKHVHLPSGLTMVMARSTNSE